MRRYPNYTYLPLTTRGGREQGSQGVHPGSDHERPAGGASRPSRSIPNRTHVFLCGNPKMIGVPDKNRETGERVFPQPPGVIEILEQRGFQTDQPSLKIKGNIHYEEYW